MAKFTFKKHRATGRYRSFELDYTDIKLNKKVVGSISESRDRKWKERYGIGFMLKKERTGKDPAPFKWTRLKKRFANENEARQFIKDNEEAIQKQFDLYFHDDL